MIYDLLPSSWAVTSQGHVLAAGVYLSGCLFTFAFLWRVGRHEASRRILQFGASLAWPIYWLIIPAPRAAARIWTKLLMLIAFVLVSPVIVLGFGLALAFEALARRNLMPRFVFSQRGVH